MQNSVGGSNSVSSTTALPTTVGAQRSKWVPSEGAALAFTSEASMVSIAPCPAPHHSSPAAWLSEKAALYERGLKARVPLRKPPQESSWAVCFTGPAGATWAMGFHAPR